MHLGMPECHKPFLGHCDLDLWPSFQELLFPEHISYIIWCRNPKFGVVIPLGMAEWCIQFWVILTLTLTSGFISRFFLLYYSYLSSNVSCARPIPLGAFVTCLWHFLFCHVLTMSLCASVYMCVVVTCWERADLLALVCGVCCEFVTFPLVSWVRCGTWLYWFLVFAPLLTSNHQYDVGAKGQGQIF